MLEAIFMDNDGVLVDTESLFFAATRDTLSRAGITVSREEFIEYALRSGRNLLDQLAPLGWSHADIAALREERNALYAGMLARGSLLMPGAAHAVRALEPRYRMAIVTSSLRRHLVIAHRNSGIIELFETVITREDYKNSKPDPEPYLTALARMKLAPASCLVVEDSERGLASARAAGLRCIIVPNELTRGSTFAGAAAILDDLAVLPQAISQLPREAS
jgi:HAD superfamily hydrolase (TIGR01509 family)